MVRGEDANFFTYLHLAVMTPALDAASSLPCAGRMSDYSLELTPMATKSAATADARWGRPPTVSCWRGV